VTVPALIRAVAPLPEPAVAVLPSGEPATSVVVPRPEHHRATWSATRKFSLAVGVAGAAALGTGVYFGVHSSTLRDRSDRLCPNTQCGDPEGLRLNDDAKTAATRANILYAAGGAVVATAVVLWFVGASGETVIAPSGGDHQLGVAMAGSF
jgi:hypothetical protein